MTHLEHTVIQYGLYKEQILPGTLAAKIQVQVSRYRPFQR